jgi:LysR family glycine cleavage system transcriptional activator
MSFTKAAAELHVTPAALSHQVRALEDLCGQALFVRKTRSIALTEAGRLLLPGLRAGFENFREAYERINRRRQDNVLVVSATPGLTAKWLVPRLYRFLAANPNIEARVSATMAFADLDADGVDVAIRLSSGIHPGLYVEKLADESVFPLCSPKLISGRSGLKRPQDLSRFNLIHYELPITSPGVVPVWADWLRAARVKGVDATRGLRLNVADHALDAAAEGAGVVLAYRLIATADMQAGRLVNPFGPELPIVGRAYHFVCRAGREREHKIRVLRDWLFQEIADTKDKRLPQPASTTSRPKASPIRLR